MPDAGASLITPRPSNGRIFSTSRRVRLGDVDPTGRCRLDATARYLQDIARDDSSDSGLDSPMTWVVRRTRIDIHQAPVFQEWVEMDTWCSGHGNRWAERRTDLRGSQGAHIEAATVWIFIDPDTGAPRKLNQDFFDIFGVSMTGRKITARLQLPGTPTESATREHWPVRFADLDVFGHVNNAAHWVPLEEVAARQGIDLNCVVAEVDFGGGVMPGGAELCVDTDEGGFTTWLMAPDGLGSAGRVSALSSES